MQREYGEGGREIGETAGEEKHESLACPETPQIPDNNKKMKKKSINNSRRFSDEQIKMLESVFESDSKLESIKKMQVARELGLQPRQVAIWFQNRRARWKSKQIEKDYKALKANYDNLASCFESLKNEKQSLLTQLQNLNDQLLGLSCDEYRSRKDLEGGNTSTLSNHRNTNYETEARPGQIEGAIGSQDDMSRQTEHSGQPGPELFGRGSYIDGSLESPETWYIFGGANQFEQSSSISPWHNFWS